MLRRKKNYVAAPFSEAIRAGNVTNAERALTDFVRAAPDRVTHRHWTELFRLYASVDTYVRLFRNLVVTRGLTTSPGESTGLLSDAFII